MKCHVLTPYHMRDPSGLGRIALLISLGQADVLSENKCQVSYLLEEDN